MSERRTRVRASDLGLWSYCQRAWWLARVQGVPHRRPALLADGTAYHETHGQRAVRAQGEAHWGRLLIACALLLAGSALLLWLVGLV